MESTDHDFFYFCISKISYIKKRDSGKSIEDKKLFWNRIIYMYILKAWKIYLFSLRFYFI